MGREMVASCDRWPIIAALLSASFLLVLGECFCSEAPESVIGLGWLQEAELSPDGRYLATCSDAGLHIWDMGGSLVSALSALNGTLLAGVSWSPTVRMLAVSTYWGPVKVVSFPGMSTIADLETGQRSSWGWGSDPDPIEAQAAHWSPDGSLLAANVPEGTCIYNISNKKRVRVLQGPQGDTLDWSSDGSILLTTCANGSAVYNTTTWEIMFRVRQTDQPWRDPLHASLSLDGRIAALSMTTRQIGDSTFTSDYFLQILSSRGALLASTPIVTEDTSWDDPIYVEWSPGGESIAVGTKDGRILIYNSSGSLAWNLSAHEEEILSISWRGRYLASASADKTVKIWETDGTSAPGLVRTITGWDMGATAVEWYPNKDAIMAQHAPGAPSVTVYRLNGDIVLRLGPPISEWFSSAAVSSDGRMIATAGGLGVQIWDAVYGTLALTMPAGGGWRPICKFSPRKSTILATASSHGPETTYLHAIEIWDVEHAAQPVVRIPTGDLANSIDFSPEGDLLAVALPSRVEIWDISRPSLLAEIKTWTNLQSVSWSADGTMLATLDGYQWGDIGDRPPYGGAFELARLRVYGFARGKDTANTSLLGQVFVPRPMMSFPVQGSLLDWDPVSDLLALATGHPFGGWSGTPEPCLMSLPGVAIVRLDGMGGFIPVLNLTGPARPTRSITWSPDGSRIAAGSEDGTISIWRIGTIAPVSESCIEFAVLISMLFWVAVTDHARRTGYAEWWLCAMDP